MEDGQLYESIKAAILGKKEGYIITKDNGQYCVLSNGKRIYQYNNDPKRSFIYLGILEDGGTRTVFNGSVTTIQDFKTIDNCTFS